MYDENTSSTYDNATNAQLSLLDLPIEIFLYICSFLKASTLVHSLSLVCKQFYLILKDDSLWKMRIHRIWPDASYPVLHPARSDKLFWKLSCVAIEKQAALWKQQDSMKKLSLSNVHFSTIDAVLLMRDGNVCISGARDRSLVYWILPSQDNEREKADCIDCAHKSWIWDLTAIDNTVYSCSSDRCVKSWLLTNTSLMQQGTYTTIVSGALLCVSSCPEQNLIATGSSNKTVFVFDARSQYQPIVHYQPHTKSVIKLLMNSEYILSASEDRTISIWDQRARRIMKTITISDKAFPMDMCMQRDMVYVGDSAAMLHVLNPKHDFEVVKSYTTEHTKKITGVRFTHGCLITSSSDKTIRISSPTDPPRTLATLTTEFGEIASMDYLNNVLAVSGTGIEIWRPKSICSEK